MYTPSLYGCLSSLLSSGQLKGGEQIGMFSYGSGVCSTFYTIKVNSNEQFSKIIRVFKDLPHRLENRTKITPGKISKIFRNFSKRMILIKIIKAEMEILCAQRESANGLRKTDLENGWIPAGPVGNLEWGATYLDQIDSRWRRSYSIHSGEFSNDL